MDEQQAAIRCARSRRSCPGCDWQHLCAQARMEVAAALAKEHSKPLAELEPKLELDVNSLVSIYTQACHVLAREEQAEGLFGPGIIKLNVTLKYTLEEVVPILRGVCLGWSQRDAAWYLVLPGEDGETHLFDTVAAGVARLTTWMRSI